MHQSRVGSTEYLAVVMWILIVAIGDASARPRIDAVLSETSQWTLNVDGTQATVTLLKGKTGATNNGGFEVFYYTDFNGRKGSIHGVSDSTNTMQRVTLEFTRKSGSHVKCTGFIAQESDKLMAGRCGDKSAPGAWFAVRADTALGAKSSAKHSKPDKGCHRNLENARRLWGEAHDRSIDRTNALNRCHAELIGLKKLKQRTSVKPFASVRNQIALPDMQEPCLTGSCPKADALSPQFPAPPNSKDRPWYLDHNEGLHKILRLGYSEQEIASIDAYEQDNDCTTVFCLMSIRVQAIYYMLGGE